MNASLISTCLYTAMIDQPASLGVTCSVCRVPQLFGFLVHDYCNKSVATQNPHNAGLAQVGLPGSNLGLLCLGQ
jgi:hypothetical protein